MDPAIGARSEKIEALPVDGDPERLQALLGRPTLGVERRGLGAGGRQLLLRGHAALASISRRVRFDCAETVRACNDARSARSPPSPGARTVASTAPSLTMSPSRNSTSSMTPATFAGTCAERPGSASTWPVAIRTGATIWRLAGSVDDPGLGDDAVAQLDAGRELVVAVALAVLLAALLAVLVPSSPCSSAFVFGLAFGGGRTAVAPEGEERQRE
jgi:hypothetical protein